MKFLTSYFIFSNFVATTMPVNQHNVVQIKENDIDVIQTKKGSVDIEKEIIFFDKVLTRFDICANLSLEEELRYVDDEDLIFMPENPITIALSDKQAQALANPEYHDTKIDISLKGMINTPLYSGKMSGTISFNRQFKEIEKDTFTLYGSNQNKGVNKFYIKALDKKIEYKTDGVFLTFKPWIHMDIADYYKYWPTTDPHERNRGQWQFAINRIGVSYNQQIYDLNVYPQKDLEFIVDPNKDINFINKEIIKKRLEQELTKLYPELPENFFDVDKSLNLFNFDVPNPRLNTNEYTLNLFVKNNFNYSGQMNLRLLFTKQINLNDVQLSKHEYTIEELKSELLNNYIYKNEYTIVERDSEIVVNGNNTNIFGTLKVSKIIDNSIDENDKNNDIDDDEDNKCNQNGVEGNVDDNGSLNHEISNPVDIDDDSKHNQDDGNIFEDNSNDGTDDKDQINKPADSNDDSESEKDASDVNKKDGANKENWPSDQTENHDSNDTEHQQDTGQNENHYSDETDEPSNNENEQDNPSMHDKSPQENDSQIEENETNDNDEIEEINSSHNFKNETESEKPFNYLWLLLIPIGLSIISIGIWLVRRMLKKKS